MAISGDDFWSFIIELVTRNPNPGIPALEDGLFANSKGREKEREKGKGKEKGESFVL